MSTYKLVAEFSTKTLRLLTLKSFRINRSVSTLVDSGEAMLADTSDSNSIKLEERVSRGDYISLKAGWEGVNIKEEFRGFVTSVNTSRDATIRFEDYSYLFKITPIEAKQFEGSTTVDTILNYLASQVNKAQSPNLPPGEQIRVVTDRALRKITLPRYIIEPKDGLSALRSIARYVPYPIYFRDNILCLYRRFVQDTSVKGKIVTLDVTKNIYGIDLEYMKAKDREYLCEYFCINPRTFEYVAGTASSGGLNYGQYIRNVYSYPLEDGNPVSTVAAKALMQSLAEEKLLALSYDGFEGTIKIKISPYVDRGYLVRIIDTKYKAREGDYFVSSFTLSGGSTKGSSRILRLGKLKI